MTTEVSTGPQLAALGPRALAFLLDWVAGYAILFAAVAILGAAVGAVSASLGSSIGLLGAAAGVAYGFWQVYQEGTTGQTLGKRRQGLRVVGLDNGGQPVGFPSAFLRYLVNSVCVVFWLVPVFDARRQTVGDKVSKTIVVPA